VELTTVVVGWRGGEDEPVAKSSGGGALVLGESGVQSEEKQN
jgi:hypothetical protein